MLALSHQSYTFLLTAHDAKGLGMDYAFVVTGFINYEGSEVEGVFQSKDAAEEYKKKVEKEEGYDEVRVTTWVYRKS